MAGAPTINLSFEYGTTTSYSTATAARPVTAVGAYSENVTGLTPDTQYNFRAKADGLTYGIVFGANTTFITWSVAPSGKIAFASNRDGATRIWVMAVNGSNQVSITPETGSHDNPSWSPDGSRIAFQSTRDGNTEIYVMDSDGSNPVRLTNNPAVDSDPAWSPDGTKIVFVSNRDGNNEIYIMSTDGTNQVRLTSNSGDDAYPSWAPGSKILYRGGYGYQPWSIFTMNADGSGNTRLTSSSSSNYEVFSPAWAPDGSAIAFTQSFDGGLCDIHTMNTDGTGVVRIVTSPNPYTSLHPAWSPDSTKIAFTYKNRDNSASNIAFMARNGQNQTVLTSPGYNCWHPSWSQGAWVAPAVSSNPATDTALNGARLHGNLTSMGSGSTVRVSFQWGTSSGSYPNETAIQSFNAASLFTAELTGLNSNTTYYYRAKAVGNGIAYGAERSFTTGRAPVVYTAAASNITSTSATLNGNLSSLGSAATINVSFEYGTTVSYGLNTTPQPLTATGNFSTAVSGLVPTTVYHYRAKADGGTQGYAYGADMLVTAGTSAPSVTTSPASNLTGSSATLNGNLTGFGTASSVTVSFEYGLTTGYGSVTSVQSMVATGNFSAAVSGLAGATLYHYRAKADGGAHGLGYGADVSFTTTAVAPQVATDPATNITATSAILHGRLISKGSAASVNVSFEYGATTSYGSSSSSLAMTAPGAFTATIINLTAGTTYHFRAKADGGANGVATGADMVISRGGTVEVNTGQTSAVNRGDVLALPLEIRNIPSLGTGNGIGAFTFDLTWDKNVVTVSSLTAATITGWTINTGTIDSVNGTVRITGYTANSYFTANVTIATLNLSATGALGSSTPVGVTVVSLGDKDSNAVGAAAVSATVRIINPLAETSIAPFTDTDSVVTVSVNINRVKDRLDGRTSVVPGGIGAYSATAACAPASGIEYVAVREVAPYVDPVFNATTGIFAVFSVASPMQPSNSTVARLVPKLVGDCNTSYTLTVSF